LTSYIRFTLPTWTHWLKTKPHESNHLFSSKESGEAYAP